MGNDYQPDPGLLIPFTSPEHQLWCAALHLLLDDAARYAIGKKPNVVGTMDDGLKAFQTVVEMREPLIYLCSFCGYDAETISQQFCRNIGLSNKKEFI